jgi:hypothetical protein
LEATKLLAAFLEGAMEGLGYQVDRQSLWKGIITLSALKKQNRA